MPCTICKEDGHNRRTCQWAPPIRKRMGKHMVPFCGTKKQPQDEPPICVICLDHVEKARAILECGHTYCTSCISQHVITSNKCPQCRQIIMPEEIPNVRDFDFIFVYSVDIYINSVQGIPTNNWRQELSAILLSNIVHDLARVNMRAPSPYDDEGNTSEWLIRLIIDGIDLISKPLIEEYIPMPPSPPPRESNQSNGIITTIDTPQLNNIAINGTDLSTLFDTEMNTLLNNNSGGAAVIDVDERAMNMDTTIHNNR